MCSAVSVGPLRHFVPPPPMGSVAIPVFLARALGCPASAADWFTDDDGTTHEANINGLADAAVTLGCEPGLFCPEADVTRGQMAAFLRRACDGAGLCATA